MRDGALVEELTGDELLKEIESLKSTNKELEKRNESLIKMVKDTEIFRSNKCSIKEGYQKIAGIYSKLKELQTLADELEKNCKDYKKYEVHARKTLDTTIEIIIDKVSKRKIDDNSSLPEEKKDLEIVRLKAKNAILEEDNTRKNIIIEEHINTENKVMEKAGRLVQELQKELDGLPFLKRSLEKSLEEEINRIKEVEREYKTERKSVEIKERYLKDLIEDNLEQKQRNHQDEIMNQAVGAANQDATAENRLEIRRIKQEKERLEVKEKRLEQLDTLLSRKEKRLADERKEIREREVMLEAKRKEIREREVMLEAKGREIKGREIVMLEDKEKEINKLKDEIKDKEKLIKALMSVNENNKAKENNALTEASQNKEIDGKKIHDSSSNQSSDSDLDSKKEKNKERKIDSSDNSSSDSDLDSINKKRNSSDDSSSDLSSTLYNEIYNEINKNSDDEEEMLRNNNSSNLEGGIDLNKPQSDDNFNGSDSAVSLLTMLPIISGTEQLMRIGLVATMIKKEEGHVNNTNLIEVVLKQSNGGCISSKK